MPRQSVGVDCLTAAQVRIALAFDNFPKVCVSYSAGKDSTVLLHLVMQEAQRRNRKVAVLLVDLEAQYTATVDHGEALFEMYADNIEPYWVALPIHLRNAVSVFEPFWMCWDPSAVEAWVRMPPKFAITDPDFFPFFQPGMEFEEFVPLFADWYSAGVDTAFFVGIRTQESYNRFLTIASPHKAMWDGYRFTTGVCSNSDSYNFYPLYDWVAEDIWTFHGKHPDLPYNPVYDLMNAAGVPLVVQRICQPYGDDQRRGLWLYHLLEPQTWSRVVARVNGANGGALYSKEHGNINGYRKVSKPDHLTWKEFAYYLVESMPAVTQEHYANKIGVFVRWWQVRGYPEGIPDEVDYDLEIQKLAPSWRRVCKSIIRNDWWCKGLGFSQQKSAAYSAYLDMMRERRERGGFKSNPVEKVSDV